MKCPRKECEGEASKVVETRELRRRRKCLICEYTWWTIEAIDLDSPVAPPGQVRGKRKPKASPSIVSKQKETTVELITPDFDTPALSDSEPDEPVDVSKVQVLDQDEPGEDSDTKVVVRRDTALKRKIAARKSMEDVRLAKELGLNSKDPYE